MLKVSASNLEKFCKNGSLNEETKSHLAGVFSFFKELVDMDPAVFQNNGYRVVKTFAPIEFIAVAVLISMYEDSRSHETILGDIRTMRQSLRQSLLDLRTNKTTWDAIWRFLEELESYRGAFPTQKPTGQDARHAPQKDNTQSIHPRSTETSRRHTTSAARTENADLGRKANPTMTHGKADTNETRTETRTFVFRPSPSQSSQESVTQVDVIPKSVQALTGQSSHDVTQNVPIPSDVTFMEKYDAIPRSTATIDTEKSPKPRRKSVPWDHSLRNPQSITQVLHAEQNQQPEQIQPYQSLQRASQRPSPPKLPDTLRTPHHNPSPPPPTSTTDSRLRKPAGGSPRIRRPPPPPPLTAPMAGMGPSTAPASTPPRFFPPVPTPGADTLASALMAAEEQREMERQLLLAQFRNTGHDRAAANPPPSTSTSTETVPHPPPTAPASSIPSTPTALEIAASAPTPPIALKVSTSEAAAPLAPAPMPTAKEQTRGQPPTTPLKRQASSSLTAEGSQGEAETVEEGYGGWSSAKRRQGSERGKMARRGRRF